MKKVIFLVVTCLALIATVGAATYTARVGISATSNVGHTQNAELAVFFDKGDPIANDILNYTGDPKVVKVNFKKIQRNSEYIYQDVLKITNNKDYYVWLCVESVSGNLGAWYAGGSYGQPANNKFNFKIMGHSSTTGDQCFYVDGHGGPAWPNTSYGWVKVNPGETALVSFYLKSGDLTAGGDYNGTITFKAMRVTP
jgi:hypothetical protein